MKEQKNFFFQWVGGWDQSYLRIELIWFWSWAWQQKQNKIRLISIVSKANPNFTQLKATLNKIKLLWCQNQSIFFV